MIKASDLRSKSVEELNEELENLQTEHFNLRFQHKTNKLENYAQLKNVRKDIARVKTVLRELELKKEGRMMVRQGENK